MARPAALLAPSAVRRPPSAVLPRLIVNGRERRELPLLRNGSAAYLPVSIAEALGAEVYLQAGSRSAIIAVPGHLYTLMDGSVRTGRGEPLLTLAPRWRNGMLYVPGSFLGRLGAKLRGRGQDIGLEFTPLPIDRPTLVAHPDKLQLVLHLPRPTGTSLGVDPRGDVTLALHGATWPDENPHSLISGDQDRLLQEAEITPTDTGVQVRLHLRYPAPVDLYWLDHPTRLVLDIPRTFSTGRVQQMAAGWRRTQLIRSTPDRQMDFHLLRVALADPHLVVRPAVAVEANGSKVRPRLLPVSVLAQRQGAIAGVNASYFSSMTEGPLGLVLVDRQMLSPPLYDRTALGLTQDGQALIAPSAVLVPLSVLVDGRDGRSCDGVNPAVAPDGLVLYTPAFGPRTPVPAREREVPLEFAVGPDGAVLTQGSAPMAIPADGFVLSGRAAGGRWLRQYLQVGKSVGIVVDPGRRSNVVHALGAGPRLLQDGRVHIAGAEELFKDDILNSRAPRTAAGIPAGNGELLLLVADGRQFARSLPGLTLEEAAVLLQESGAREAVNFDGGGSSTLYLGGRVVNAPSDGKERRVSAALLILPGR